MVTGKRFQLRKDTVAIADNGGKREAVTVPAGAIVKVIAGPDQGDRLIDVLWDGKSIMMFAVDVFTRGTEIKP
jgi:hypothetical protein